MDEREEVVRDWQGWRKGGATYLDVVAVLRPSEVGPSAGGGVQLILGGVSGTSGSVSA